MKGWVCYDGWVGNKYLKKNWQGRDIWGKGGKREGHKGGLMKERRISLEIGKSKRLCPWDGMDVVW